MLHLKGSRDGSSLGHVVFRVPAMDHAWDIYVVLRVPVMDHTWDICCVLKVPV